MMAEWNILQYERNFVVLTMCRADQETFYNLAEQRSVSDGKQYLQLVPDSQAGGPRNLLSPTQRATSPYGLSLEISRFPLSLLSAPREPHRR